MWLPRSRHTSAGAGRVRAAVATHAALNSPIVFTASFLFRPGEGDVDGNALSGAFFSLVRRSLADLLRNSQRVCPDHSAVVAVRRGGTTAIQEARRPKLSLRAPCDERPTPRSAASSCGDGHGLQPPRTIAKSWPSTNPSPLMSAAQPMHDDDGFHPPRTIARSLPSTSPSPFTSPGG